MRFDKKIGRRLLLVAMIGSCILTTLFSAQSEESLKEKSEVEKTDEKGSEDVEAVAEETKEEEKKKKERPKSISVDELTPRERRNLERMLTDQGHVLYRGDTPYIRDWSFQSGVVELNVPAYEGWVNVTKKKDLYLDFARQGVPGQTLSGVYINTRYIRATRSKYINFYVLAWVPERFAYKQFNPKKFAPIKEKLQAELIAVRRRTTEREDFQSFDDYLNFKFGKDEELEEFVDGRMIKAAEGDDYLTYFFTSEFLIQDEESPVTEPMLGTTTFGLVRGKLIRYDIRMVYRSDDDVARILEFTQQYFDDLQRVNSTDKP